MMRKGETPIILQRGLKLLNPCCPKKIKKYDSCNFGLSLFSYVVIMISSLTFPLAQEKLLISFM